jgi:hypothetical protein
MRSFVIRRARYISLLSFWVACACLAAHAQKVKVEHDKSVDFTKFKTYAIDPIDNASRPMLHLAIQGAIEHDLNRLGLTKVASDPDLYVQMYGAIESDFTVHYHDPLYGGYVPPVNAITLWHNVPGTYTTVVIPKGTLMVDLIDANRKQLVWRGVSKQKLSDQRDEVLHQVNTAVEKMFLKYPAGNQ